MKGSGLTRLYDQFTPAERFQLVARARGRGDEEVGRLCRTCPRQTYVVADHASLERWEAAPWIAERAFMLWTEYLAQYDTLLRIVENYLDAHHYFLRGYIAGARAVWQEVGKTGTRRRAGPESPIAAEAPGLAALPDSEVEEFALAMAVDGFPPSLERELQVGLARVKAVPAALDKFCARIGVARGDPLAWFPPLQAQLDACRAMLASGVPADEETVTDIERLFVDNWPD